MTQASVCSDSRPVVLASRGRTFACGGRACSDGTVELARGEVLSVSRLGNTRWLVIACGSTIINDGSTWEGGCTGTTTWTVTEPEHMHDMDCTLVGAGGYAGLRFVFTVTGGDVDPWQMTGQIEPATGSPRSP